MSDDFDWSEFAGAQWRPEQEGDTLVGTVTAIRVEDNRGRKVPVLTIAEKDTGREREVWTTAFLMNLLHDHNVQVADQVAIKFTGTKNVGQPQPMKVFALKVKKAGAAIEPPPQPTPTEPEYAPDEQPF